MCTLSVVYITVGALVLANIVAAISGIQAACTPSALPLHDECADDTNIRHCRHPGLWLHTCRMHAGSAEQLMYALT